MRRALCYLLSVLGLAFGLVAVGSTTPASAISAPIHITDTVNIRPGPSTGSGAPLGTIPTGASPDFHCWAQGENISGVDVWFNVTWSGVTGYYTSYYDDSHYPSDSDITGIYGIPQCGTGGGNGGTTALEQAAVNWATPWASRHDPGYHNLCLSFVFDAYANAGANLRPWVNYAIDGDTYPADIWGKFNHGTTGGGTPPVGALVFFNSTTGDRTLSHVTISTGGGNMISTSDAVDGNGVHFETLAQHSYAIYLGWWLPDGGSQPVQVTPSVGVSPSTGDHTTLFQGSGAGFTPNSTMTARVIAPDGNEYGAAYTKNRAVDGSGNFSWTWVWDPGDEFGTYTYVATDATGPQAQTTFTITAPSVTPSVGVAPTAGDSNTVFHGTGSGFTPNSTVSATVIAPDGNEYGGAYTRSRSVDGSGAFTWTWVWDPGDQFGTYTYIATDSTGPQTQVTFTLNAPDMSHPAPLAGFDTMSAPPASTMTAWLASPYRAVGVYIPVKAGSDNRADKVQANLTPTWVRGVRAQGWSIVPIYLGPQAPQACFPADYWRMSEDPATARAQGQAAAADAIASMTALGLPSTSPVYYDMEPYGSGCSGAVLAYVDGWVQGLHAKHRIAGVYGNRSSMMTDLASQVGVATYHLPDAVWVETNNGSNGVGGLGTPADDQWATHARMNQAALDQVQTYGGVSMNIDVDAIDAPVVPATASSPLALDAPAPRVAVTGKAYSYRLVASGGKKPYTWALASGQLPAGLTLSATGVVSGTPTTAGTAKVVVRLTDANTPHTSVTTRVTFVVEAPLTVVTTQLADGLKGSRYAAALAATGGKPRYTWSVVAGTLPPGVTLSGTGVFAGKPTAAGRYRFTVGVVDATAGTPLHATKQLTITVGVAKG